MILGTIWERYILRELFKVFFLFLSCFFFLYALIDYSLHCQDFITNKEIHIPHIAVYYIFQFIKRGTLLVPLALLISTLKVLLSLNTRGELVALQASGLKLKKILRPFFFFATVCTLFNLASAEFFLPQGLNHLDQFRVEHFKHSRKGNRKEPVHVLPLKDRSKIIYQIEDKEKKLYLDVFWIRSADEIWRIGSLSTDPENPVGKCVDALKRNAEGNFEKGESYDEYRFSKFRWEPDPIGKGYIPLENRSLSALMKMISQKNKTTAYEYPQALTHFLFKLIIPFLSLLVVIAAAPFCWSHSRNLHVFFIYSIALFGFITFFAMMDASVIIGENQVASPFIAVLLPFATCAAIVSFHYHKQLHPSCSKIWPLGGFKAPKIDFGKEG